MAHSASKLCIRSSVRPILLVISELRVLRIQPPPPQAASATTPLTHISLSQRRSVVVFLWLFTYIVKISVFIIWLPKTRSSTQTVSGVSSALDMGLRIVKEH